MDYKVEGFFKNVERTFGKEYINTHVTSIPNAFLLNSYKNDVAPKMSIPMIHNSDYDSVYANIWVNPLDKDLRECDRDYEFVVEVVFNENYYFQKRLNDWKEVEIYAHNALQIMNCYKVWWEQGFNHHVDDELVLKSVMAVVNGFGFETV